VLAHAVVVDPHVGGDGGDADRPADLDDVAEDPVAGRLSESPGLGLEQPVTSVGRSFPHGTQRYRIPR